MLILDAFTVKKEVVHVDLQGMVDTKAR